MQLEIPVSQFHIHAHKAVSLRIDCFFLIKISDWSDEMNDIFKDMQAKVGCEYISDLPSYRRKVWQEMKRLNPADYEEKQLEDFSKYVFGMSYQTLKDVMKQQKGREEQCRKQGCWWKRDRLGERPDCLRQSGRERGQRHRRQVTITGSPL